MKSLRSPIVSWMAACITLVITGCANQVLLHPDTAREAAAARPVRPNDYGDAPELVTVTNRNNCRLSGWAFFSPKNRGVVLVGDGNATGLAQTYEYNRFLVKQGFNIVVLSYQGFDTNEGKADLQSLYADVESFYELCRRRCPGQPIALMAESISTAPFFCFASHHPEIAGVALEAMVDPKKVAFAKLNDWWLFYPFYPITIGAACSISTQVPDDLDIDKTLALDGSERGFMTARFLSMMMVGLLCSGCLKFERQVTSPGARGVVLDAQTRAPVSDAAIVVSRGVPYFGSDVVTVSEALTNTRPPVATTGKNGRFRIATEQHHKLIVDWLLQPYRPRGGTLLVQRVGYESAAIPLSGGFRPISSPPPTNFITVLLRPISK